MKATAVFLGVLAVAGLAWEPSRAEPPNALTPSTALTLLGSNTTAALAGNLRALLLDSLPTPLFEDHKHWGLQKPVRRVHWRGKGLRVHPEAVEVPENDGRWWKVEVTAVNPRDTLVLDLRDLSMPEQGRMLFATFVAFDTRVDFDRQTWHAGTRTYSGSVRARMRVRLTLRCEATGTLQTKDFLPEAVVRLRVLQADLGYDNFVVEHIVGVGGELAKVLGEAAHASLKQWRPSLERDLLARAGAAIIKAGDTKEVRIGVAALLGRKGGGGLPLVPVEK
jgi:hypothetical protein